jgi:hypothetical protein
MKLLRSAMIVVALVLVSATGAAAHCDSLDGPVIEAARQALESGDPTPVLKWVTAEREADILAAFEMVMSVRSESDRARELADRYFFETLVRVHRAGEGAPYTGLKPAGQIPAPIAAADRALAEGSVDELAREVAGHVESALKAKFERASSARGSADTDVESGRRFVAAYVDYVHFVENVHRAIEGASHEH